VAFATTSVGGSCWGFFSLVAIGQTFVALLSNLQAVDCLTFIGTEGFSNDVVFHVGAQLGTERCEASLVLERRAPHATLNEVQRAVLEERLSGHIVGAFVEARDPRSVDMQRILGLDPTDEKCVRTVMRFALGVFLSARDVDSWIRTFRLIDDEGVL
jgi:hypothetical protein